MNKQQLIDRKLKAERILKDDTISEALTDMKKGILRKWEDAPVRDTEGHHELKLMLKLLNDFRKTLENYISYGNQAEIEIKKEKKSFFN